MKYKIKGGNPKRKFLSREIRKRKLFRKEPNRTWHFQPLFFASFFSFYDCAWQREKVAPVKFVGHFGTKAYFIAEPKASDSERIWLIREKRPQKVYPKEKKKKERKK